MARHSRASRRVPGSARQRGLLRWITVCLLVVTTSCGTTAREGSAAAQLTGRIWDLRAGAFVTDGVVRGAVRAAPVILLGETHDNPEHHRLQRELLAEAVASGRRPALVMEQLDREFQAALDTERKRTGRTADTVLDAGQFNRRSWQVEGYRPLVAVALESGLPIIAVNVSRNDARSIVRDPARAALPPVAKRVEDDLAAEIERSHCGEKTPPALLAGMVAAQRARDVAMAQALTREEERGAVLIAGVGHVRADRGAPIYMSRRPLVIAFIEVDPERGEPKDYFDGAFATAASFDYAWFTERAGRPDPCAEKPTLLKVPAPQ
jgi:uncharacterized iron-regulated protein